MANPLPPPLEEPIARLRDQKYRPGQKDPAEGTCTDPWVKFFTTLTQAFNQAPNRLVAPISLTGQTTSIGATSIAPGQTAAGLYRLTWYTRVTFASIVSSSLQITVGWTDHGLPLTFSGVALTGNTTTTYESLTTMVYLDANTPITYATTYASNPAGQMVYQLFVILEALAR